jgi:hypothetical protein
VYDYYARLSPSGSGYSYWYLFGGNNSNYSRPDSIPAAFKVVEDMGGVGVDLDWGDE